MDITKEQVKSFKEKGFLLVPRVFSSKELVLFSNEIKRLKNRRLPGTVYEKNKEILRGMHGCHYNSRLFKSLSENARIVRPSHQILSTFDIYLYQFKVNVKAAFEGKSWPWHRDYVFWKEKDGMPSSKALSCAIFLDDCTDFNGSLMFIRGSHKIFDKRLRVSKDDNNSEINDWESDVSESLTYTEREEFLQKITTNKNLVMAKGKSGSVLFFHPNIIHASPANISPFDRKIIILTYNSCTNVPNFKKQRRPAFLVNPDSSPIKMKEELN